MQFKKLSIFAVLSTLLLTHFCLAKDPKGFTLYLTTNAENRYGGNVMIHAGSMTMQELPDVLNRASRDEAVSLLPSKDEPVEVIVIVPKGASAEMRSEFIGQIEQEMSARYPRAKYTIRESFVDVNQDREALTERREELRRLESAIPPGSPESVVAQQAEGLIDEGLSDDEALERSWGLRAADKLSGTHPYNTVIAAQIIAITKFTMSFNVMVSKYGINPMSLVIGSLSALVAAGFGYNAKRWSHWCTSHEIPWFKDNWLVRAYNKRGYLKSATINLGKGLFLDALLRGLAYGSHQTIKNKHGERELVSSPFHWSFFAQGLGIAVPEVVLDGLMDDAARGLELKGALNHQSRSYILWAIGLIDTTMHAFFRAGAVNAAYTAAAFSWGAKLAFWGASKLTRARSKRFVFISDSISEVKNGELIQNKSNFFAFLASLGKSLYQGVKNRVHGTFSVSDKEMVRQQLGLEEAWNLALTPEDFDRLQNDSKLTEAEFTKMLALGDAVDRKVVKAFWAFRQQHLGQKLDLLQACGVALGAH